MTILLPPSLTGLVLGDQSSIGSLSFGLIVTRVNLGVKQIDVRLLGLNASADRSFRMMVFLAPGSYIRCEGVTVPGRNSYQWFSQDFGISSAILKTVPLGLNIFPFESYEAETIFGFNVTGITTGRPWTSFLSYDLEQQGSWIVEAKVGPTNDTDTKLTAHRPAIEDNKLVYFRSLIIRLSHPDSYRRKMLVPAWGPILFALTLMGAQFGILRKKLEKSDHVALFVGVAVFNLGQTIAIRELTPPELTVPEFITFFLVLFYVALLTLAIRGQAHEGR